MTTQPQRQARRPIGPGPRLTARHRANATHTPRYRERPPAVAAGHSASPYPSHDRQRAIRGSHPAHRTAAHRLNRQTLQCSELERPHPEAP